MEGAKNLLCGKNQDIIIINKDNKINKDVWPYKNMHRNEDRPKIWQTELEEKINWIGGQGHS